MNTTGTSSVTVWGTLLDRIAFTGDELAQLHWALYVTHGNEWTGWEKLRRSMPPDVWTRIVQASGEFARSATEGTDDA